MRNLKFCALIGLMFGLSAMCHAANEKPIVKEKETIVLVSGDLHFSSIYELTKQMALSLEHEPFVIVNTRLEKVNELLPGVPIDFLREANFYFPESNTKTFIPDPAPDIVKQYNYTRDLRKDNNIKLHSSARLKM